MISKPVINKLQKYFKTQKNILAVYLYGSFANGLPNKMSDIDFGIVLREPFNKSKSLDLQLRYMGEISDLIRSDLEFDYVDAVILNNTSPLLKQQAISTGKLLFSCNDEQRINIEVRFLMEYEETSYLREVQKEYLVERIKNGQFGVMPKLKGLK